MISAIEVRLEKKEKDKKYEIILLFDLILD